MMRCVRECLMMSLDIIVTSCDQHDSVSERPMSAAMLLINSLFMQITKNA